MRNALPSAGSRWAAIAFDIARVNPGRFCAVGGHSPALWQTAGETAPGAFDDAEDFAAHDVIGAAQSAPEPYLSEPIWVDAGDEDPFQPGIQAFSAALEAAGAELTAKTWPGGDTGDYWRSHWADYMRFYARWRTAERSSAGRPSFASIGGFGMT